MRNENVSHTPSGCLTTPSKFVIAFLTILSRCLIIVNCNLALFSVTFTRFPWWTNKVFKFNWLNWTMYLLFCHTLCYVLLSYFLQISNTMLLISGNNENRKKMQICCIIENVSFTFLLKISCISCINLLKCSFTGATRRVVQGLLMQYFPLNLLQRPCISIRAPH